MQSHDSMWLRKPTGVHIVPHESNVGPDQEGQEQAGAPRDRPLNGRSLWDLALITPGLARTHTFKLDFEERDIYFIIVIRLLIWYSLFDFSFYLERRSRLTRE